MINLVLGSHSMIGRHLTPLLPNCIGIYRENYDLSNLETCKEVFDFYSDSETVVYNLTGFNGGLGLNLSLPSDIFYRSTQLNLNILKCCQEYKVKKVVNVISACSYPDNAGEMKEEDLFNGMPNPTVECHGFAKRILLEYSRQAHKQYGLKSVCVVLTNIFGPQDRFDLCRTKVVGAAVKKLCEAKLANSPSVTFFGTGSPVRELMYAGDAAACLVQVAEKYEDCLQPINISSNNPLSIREMVDVINDEVGYKGEILWDTSKPDGQAYRKLSVEKMNKYISHEMTPFRVGVRKTIEYYLSTGRFLDR